MISDRSGPHAYPGSKALEGPIIQGEGESKFTTTDAILC